MEISILQQIFAAGITMLFAIAFLIYGKPETKTQNNRTPIPSIPGLVLWIYGLAFLSLSASVMTLLGMNVFMGSFSVPFFLQGIGFMAAIGVNDCCCCVERNTCEMALLISHTSILNVL